MNTYLQPIVLEARFGQLAVAWQPGDLASRAALDAVGEQARMALRGVDVEADKLGSASLGRAASRLARRLLIAQGGAVALEQGILRRGIETGRHLDPLEVAAAVRRVRDGSAQLPASDTSSDDPAAAQSRLFTQIALVALLARSRAP